MWETIETKAGKCRVAETERRRKEKGGREKKRRKSRREKRQWR